MMKYILKAWPLSNFEILLQYQISANTKNWKGANTIREKSQKTEVDDSTDLDDIGDKYFFHFN